MEKRQKTADYLKSYRKNHLDKTRELAKKHSKIYRAKVKENPEKKAEALGKVRERMKKYRERKIHQRPDEVLKPFSNVQSKGKCVKKVIEALPKDPLQRNEVLVTLLNDSLHKEITVPLVKSGRKGVSAEEKLHVERFFSDDEISRQSPNVKDFVPVRLNGKKEKLQVRHLLYPLKEVHQLFIASHPEIKIALSKFCDLRPPFVFSTSKMPHNVCVCTSHENMRFALEALVKSDPIFFSNINVGSKMIDNFVCQDPFEACFYNNCSDCKDLKEFQRHLDGLETLNFEISWSVWQKPEKTSYANIEKVSKSGTAENLVDHLLAMRAKFTTHSSIKQNQSRVFKDLIEKSKTASSSVAVMQIDYAENYKCFSQNEPQAAHFGQNQISLFTCAIWNEFVKTFVIASDSLDHTKNSVVANLQRLLENVPSTVDSIHIFSDNATSQFKNKVVLGALIPLQKEIGKRLFWHFFAAMHGKGVVDGVGAAIKRSASTKVKSGLVEIKSAIDFVNAVKDGTTKAFLMTEIEKKTTERQYKAGSNDKTSEKN